MLKNKDESMVKLSQSQNQVINNNVNNFIQAPQKQICELDNLLLDVKENEKKEKKNPFIRTQGEVFKKPADRQPGI